MNAAYEKCNWKVKVLTQTAVSNYEGSGEFFSDNDLANLEVGGTIFGKKNFYNCFISGQKKMFINSSYRKVRSIWEEERKRQWKSN